MRSSGYRIRVGSGRAARGSASQVEGRARTEASRATKERFEYRKDGALDKREGLRASAMGLPCQARSLSTLLLMVCLAARCMLGSGKKLAQCPLHDVLSPAGLGDNTGGSVQTGHHGGASAAADLHCWRTWERLQNSMQSV